MPDNIEGRIADIRRPKKPHLTRRSGGLAAEILDLRNDVANLFANLSEGSSLVVGNGRIESYKHDLAAVRDPEPSDDAKRGFRRGSLWMNAATQRAFILSRDTPGSAVWLELSDAQKRTLIGRDPGVSDDSRQKHTLGSLWFNTAEGEVWVCVDPTPCAASWKRVTTRDYDTFRFNVVGVVSVATAVDGSWFAPFPGKITRVVAYRDSTAGTSGSTIIDVNLNGTSIFTTQANRPTIDYDDADGKVVVTNMDVTVFRQDDRISVDVDQIDTGGAPSDLDVVLGVEYTGLYNQG